MKCFRILIKSRWVIAIVGIGVLVIYCICLISHEPFCDSVCVCVSECVCECVCVCENNVCFNITQINRLLVYDPSLIKSRIKYINTCKTCTIGACIEHYMQFDPESSKISPMILLTTLWKL